MALRVMFDFSFGAVREFVFGAMICLILTCAPPSYETALQGDEELTDDWLPDGLDLAGAPQAF